MKSFINLAKDYKAYLPMDTLREVNQYLTQVLINPSRVATYAISTVMGLSRFLPEINSTEIAENLREILPENATELVNTSIYASALQESLTYGALTIYMNFVEILNQLREMTPSEIIKLFEAIPLYSSENTTIYFNLTEAIQDISPNLIAALDDLYKSENPNNLPIVWQNPPERLESNVGISPTLASVALPLGMTAIVGGVYCYRIHQYAEKAKKVLSPELYKELKGNSEAVKFFLKMDNEHPALLKWMKDNFRVTKELLSSNIILSAFMGKDPIGLETLEERVKFLESLAQQKEIEYSELPQIPEDNKENNKDLLTP